MLSVSDVLQGNPELDKGIKKTILQNRPSGILTIRRGRKALDHLTLRIPVSARPVKMQMSRTVRVRMVRTIRCLASLQNTFLWLNKYSCASRNRKKPRQKISMSIWMTKLKVQYLATCQSHHDPEFLLGECL